jgi:thiamine-phosphate pyrophosphorylase
MAPVPHVKNGRRERLAKARLQLLFTPELAAPRDPLEVLEAVLPFVDLVQVRIKGPGSSATSPARATAEWTARVLERTRAHATLVIVNDRADVARALLAEGCDGVHLGQDDMPPGDARELLGQDALIGLSTHDAAQVVLAGEQPLDYLGFGPVFPTATKGYTRGVGPEAAWVAAEATSLPVFAIGGIDLSNVDQLDRVGRAAVSSALLGADDPGETAREMRALLLG